jgi:DNA (cytosine-5)-methyltransferase 1
MIFGSVCSGIEAASVAWHPLGWRAAFLSEIAAFPRAVLAHHYPDVPLQGDFTTIGADAYEPIELLVGGTPCQSFSVAGLRGGLADERGNLALEFLRLAQRLRPRWLVWENVPGVLSSISHAAPDPCPPPPPMDLGCHGAEVDTEDKYRSEELHAFYCFLAGLSDVGYGFAYRVLDAQFFGVPQRRRRVFVVGYLGDWRPAAAVLFERASLRGDPAPRREKGTGTPVGALGGTSPGGGWRFGADEAAAGQLIAFGGNNTSGPVEIATAVNAHGGTHGRLDFESETFVCAQPLCFSAKDYGADASDMAPTLRAGGHTGSHANAGVMPAVAFAQNSRDEVRLEGGDGQTAGALKHGGGKPGQSYPAALVGSAVRRLTPRECERLQGFPDDYTLIPYRGKPAADAPRYKALGNSMAVPVMGWIGERIQAVEAILPANDNTEINRAAA